MRARDAACECEAQPDAAGLASAASVGAPERRSCEVELFGSHAHAMIDDLECDRFTLGLHGKRHRRSRVGILRGVVEKVVERAAEQHRIALERALGVVDGALELAAWITRGEASRGAIGELADTDRLALDRC